LEQKSLITRRQGRGTFVNEPASDVSTIRFIKIHGKDGERIWGEVKSSEIVEAVATECERNKLSIGIGVKVFRINRTRFDDERPLVLEHSIVPCELFPGLASRNEVLTGIYSIAQQYGHIIGRAEERITAESASVEVADALSIPAGTPVVVMDRIVHNIRGQVVEWRVGWTHLQDLYYRVDL
jgi:GntR family transcriptional regulator